LSNTDAEEALLLNYHKKNTWLEKKKKGAVTSLQEQKKYLEVSFRPKQYRKIIGETARHSRTVPITKPHLTR